MTKLQRNEEEFTYQRMLQPYSARAMTLLGTRTYSSVYVHPKCTHRHRCITKDEAIDVSFTDNNRQLTLIINILVSIIACGVAIWIVSRWLDTSTRVILSIVGSLLIGLAEVMVFCGYLRKLSEAKVKEMRTKEVKIIIDSWTVQSSDSGKCENNL